MRDGLGGGISVYAILKTRAGALGKEDLLPEEDGRHGVQGSVDGEDPSEDVLPPLKGHDLA
jgi:hypothetical protein